MCCTSVSDISLRLWGDGSIPHNCKRKNERKKERKNETERERLKLETVFYCINHLNLYSFPNAASLTGRTFSIEANITKTF